MGKIKIKKDKESKKDRKTKKAQKFIGDTKNGNLDKKELNNIAKKEKVKKKSKQNERKKLINIAVCDREFDKTKYGGLLRRYFAHRGAHNVYPENSLPAFEEAINLKMAIEIDVHLSKDKNVVVFHDDTLERMTGLNDYVRFLTLEELKKLNLNGTEYKIPTLHEVLTLVNARTPILLEVKTESNTREICKLVIEELKNYSGEVFIQSFNPFVLRYFYKHAPKYLRGQLSSFFVGQELGFLRKTVIKKLWLNKFSHVDFISYNVNNLPNKYCNKTDVPILTYTIKTQEEFDKAKQSSNNLIIDNTDLINFKK